MIEATAQAKDTSPVVAFLAAEELQVAGKGTPVAVQGRARSSTGYAASPRSPPSCVRGLC